MCEPEDRSQPCNQAALPVLRCASRSMYSVRVEDSGSYNALHACKHMHAHVWMDDSRNDATPGVRAIRIFKLDCESPMRWRKHFRSHFRHAICREVNAAGLDRGGSHAKRWTPMRTQMKLEEVGKGLGRRKLSRRRLGYAIRRKVNTAGSLGEGC